MRGRAWIAVVGVCLAAHSACAFAQPESSDGPPRERWGDRLDERERLERQLAWLDQRRARLAAELASLGTEREPQAAPEGEPGEMPSRPRWPLEPGEFRERFRAVLDEVRPAIGDRGYEVLRRDGEAPDPEARRLVGRILPKLFELTHLRDRDDEMYRAKLREFLAGAAIMRVARSIAEADEATPTPDQREELRAAIEEGHRARVAVAELELSRLAERLEEQRAQLDAAKTSGEAVINEQMDRVLERVRRARAERHRDGDERSGDD